MPIDEAKLKRMTLEELLDHANILVRTAAQVLWTDLKEHEEHLARLGASREVAAEEKG